MQYSLMLKNYIKIMLPLTTVQYRISNFYVESILISVAWIVGKNKYLHGSQYKNFDLCVQIGNSHVWEFTIS